MKHSFFLLLAILGLNLGSTDAQTVYNDYYLAVEEAQKCDKPLLLVFTSKICKNPLEINTLLLLDEDVTAAVTSTYILAMLYVDDRTPLAQVEVVIQDGQKVSLRTYGALWVHLERSRFNDNSQPLVVKLTPDESILKAPISHVGKQALIDYITAP